MVKCPSPNWKVGCLVQGRWGNCCTAPWARTFTSIAPARGKFQPPACGLTAVTNNQIKKNFWRLLLNRMLFGRVILMCWCLCREDRLRNSSSANVDIHLEINSFSFVYSPLQCHEWSAAPISTYLYRGPRRSECFTAGESMAASRVNCFLSPTHKRRARGWEGQKCRL